MPTFQIKHWLSQLLSMLLSESLFALSKEMGASGSYVLINFKHFIICIVGFLCPLLFFRGDADKSFIVDNIFEVLKLLLR